MFNNHELTRHAEIRMRQRGLRDDDVHLLLAVSSQVSPDVYLLSEQDAAHQIARRKHEIQSLERLRGCKVVVEQGRIVTCYHASTKSQKKTLRYGRAVQ